MMPSLQASFLLFLLSIHSVLGCSPGYQPFFDGWCMAIREGVQFAFDHGTDLCGRDNAHMLIIRSQKENDAFLSSLPSVVVHYPTAWIGLSCDPTKGQFVWVDGSVATFTNFDTAYACNSSTPSYNFKIDLDTGKWMQSNSVYAVACMHPNKANSPCDDFSLASSISPPICLDFHLSLRNWTDAERDCGRRAGHLVSIHDQSLNNYVWRTGLGLENKEGMHIGLRSNDGTNGGLRWTDGTPFDYDYFSPGFPDVAGHGACTSMDVSSFPGRWLNGDCAASKKAYVCAKTPFNNSQTQPLNCPAKSPYRPGDSIYSPGFPNSESASSCVMNVAASAGKSVELRVVVFEANLCCDSLVLYEGNSSTVISTLTGSIEAGTVFKSSTNAVRMEWKATSGVGVRGFHFETREL